MWKPKTKTITNQKTYNTIFIAFALGSLLILLTTWLLLHWGAADLTKLLANPKSRAIKVGALEKFQQGDLLITRVPGATANTEFPIIKPTDQTLGPANAKITIVEYTDFLCPYCGQIQALLKQALSQYPGQVRLIFKDTPNESLHPGSWLVHQAAQCAGEQNQFWPYADLIWQQNAKTLNSPQLITLAKKLKLKTDQFSSCLKNQQTFKWVWLNSKEAELLNIVATPQLYINQQILSGNLSWSSLKQLIEEELQK